MNEKGEEMQETEEEPTGPVNRSRLITYGGAGAAAVVIAVGAFAIGRSGSDPESSVGVPVSAAGVPSAAAATVPSTAGVAPAGLPDQRGPDGAPPGLSDQVTGTTEQKVEKAVLAERGGTIERVEALPDGSYIAHLITDQGEVYVAVSSDFQVTGTAQGPGQPASPDAGSSSDSDSSSPDGSAL
jgi:hypothetical protein